MISSDSEIGSLKKVIIHTPGREIEDMTPQSAAEVLYNDIIPLTVVSKEHNALKQVLSSVCEVFEVRSLLERTLESPQAREELIKSSAGVFEATERIEELSELKPAELTDKLICGIHQKKNTLSTYLNKKVFDIPPSSNLYFMRDPGAIYRDSAIVSAMANTVRNIEALFLRTIFRFHPLFSSTRIVFDGTEKIKEYSKTVKPTLEGGDVILFRKNIILLGISERTNPEAIDNFAHNIVETYNDKIDIIAVLLPKQRSTIHLDMIFTCIDYNTALVYEPYIIGYDSLPIIHMICEPGKEFNITRKKSVQSALSELGHEIDLIPCGGSNALHQQREQWLSGTNFLTLAPGKVLGYDCNAETLASLERHGFEIYSSDSFLKNPDVFYEDKKLAIGVPGSELARGGGGVRCMTMPIERESI